MPSAASRRLPFNLGRREVVWLSVLCATTAVGGLMLLLEDRPAPAPNPMALVEVAPKPQAAGLDRIFETKAQVESGRWRGVVVHHSGTALGSPESITRQHNARGLKGLGYHFVISNGQGAPDGQIFVGYRWQDQLPGAHVTGSMAEQFNRQTIGICLIGDGERREFTGAQIARLSELVGALQQRLAIDDQFVYLHRDVAPTASPGRLFPESNFRQRLADAR